MTDEQLERLVNVLRATNIALGMIGGALVCIAIGTCAGV